MSTVGYDMYLKLIEQAVSEAQGVEVTPELDTRVELAVDAFLPETFFKAYRALDSFRGECDEKTWLMRIAINTCRDMRRSRWTRHVDRRVTPEMLPEASAPFEERDEELTLALMRLPPKQREAVLLRYYQRMSLAQTAQAMGVTVSTVSKQLGRALRSLRGILEGGREHE